MELKHFRIVVSEGPFLGAHIYDVKALDTEDAVRRLASRFSQGDQDGRSEGS